MGSVKQYKQVLLQSNVKNITKRLQKTTYMLHEMDLKKWKMIIALWRSTFRERNLRFILQGWRNRSKYSVSTTSPHLLASMDVDDCIFTQGGCDHYRVCIWYLHTSYIGFQLAMKIQYSTSYIFFFTCLLIWLMPNLILFFTHFISAWSVISAFLIILLSPFVETYPRQNILRYCIFSFGVSTLEGEMLYLTHYTIKWRCFLRPQYCTVLESNLPRPSFSIIVIFWGCWLWRRRHILGHAAALLLSN